MVSMTAAGAMRGSSMAAEGETTGMVSVGSAGLGLGGVGGLNFQGQKLIDGDVLGCEDAVEAFEGEGAFAVEEVGDVGLLESCLVGEARAGEGSAFDAAEELDAKEFVQVLEVHGRRVPSRNHIIQKDEDKEKM